MRSFSGPEPREAFGVVVPFDMELDAELWRWLPNDVDLLIARTPYVPGTVNVDFIEELLGFDDIDSAVRSVVGRRAKTAVYACTSASFVRGVDGERRIREAMHAAGAAEPATSTGAMVEALDLLGAKRVSLVSPYVPALATRFDSYFEECGLDVHAHLSLGRDHSIWTVPYSETAEMIRRVNTPEAEAIVIGCTNLPTYDIIAQLEQELHKPIITANQTAVWAALRRMGRRAVGPGQRLLEL